MNASLVIMEFLPLIVYIGVDAWKGFRAGIIAAMICTLVMLGYDFVLFKELDKFILGEGIMILVLGAISLKMNNDRYFKFQPTVLALVFAGVFAWFQFFDQPLMLHFVPHMEKLFQSQPTELRALDSTQLASAEASPMLEMLHSEHFRKILSRLSGHMIWLFIAHGLIMTYAAIRLKTAGWFAWRLAIYPALFILVVINQLFA
ncbi:MAG TPA: septation protein IspZ [Oligoflexus sp.]|uniref:septation protein IspZ n=1 Tax=Oligoflexus sp. TaxID=1971216 RepID=UPI002D7FAF24|nr:septation protein IspZ [Oligoflexus sp.]HET9240271.1 septation protein IspZ [Oligoflexus sp.]